MHRLALSLGLTLAALVVPARVAAQSGPCDGLDPTSTAYAAIAGPWVAYGASLDVRAEGCATYSWRTYIWCAPARVDDCDSIGPAGEIRPGGAAGMRFTGRGADGAISAGATVTTLLSGRPQAETVPATLRPGPGGTLQVAIDDRGVRLLCRPWAYDPGNCGA